MRSNRRNRFLRNALKPEPVEHPSDRTENEETRRRARDWLRDLDEETTVEFEPEELG